MSATNLQNMTPQELEDKFQAFLESQGMPRNTFTINLTTPAGSVTIVRDAKDQLDDDLVEQAADQAAVDVAHAATDAAKARQSLADADLFAAKARQSLADADLKSAQEVDEITDRNIQAAHDAIALIQSHIAVHKEILLGLDAQLEAAIFALEEANIADAAADKVLDEVVVADKLAEEATKLAQANDESALADVIAAQEAQKPLEENLAEITKHVEQALPHIVDPIIALDIIPEVAHDSSDDEENIPEVAHVEPVAPVIESVVEVIPEVAHDSSDDEENIPELAPVEPVAPVIEPVVEVIPELAPVEPVAPVIEPVVEVIPEVAHDSSDDEENIPEVAHDSSDDEENIPEVAHDSSDDEDAPELVPIEPVIEPVAPMGADTLD